MSKQESAEDIWNDPTGGEGIIGMMQNMAYDYKHKKKLRQIKEMKEDAELLKAKAELEKAKEEYKEKTGKEPDEKKT
jgi:hypothetical protein